LYYKGGILRDTTLFVVHTRIRPLINTDLVIDYPMITEEAEWTLTHPSLCHLESGDSGPIPNK